MRAVIQRVSSASVTVDGHVQGRINQGLVVLLGIGHEDTAEEVSWLSKKIAQLRIFSDEAGQMNLSVNDVNGAVLLISQFTLYAQTKKGNRPSFTQAAKPPVATILYEQMKSALKAELGTTPETGIFGADMKVELVNDGPVTICIDTNSKE